MRPAPRRPSASARAMAACCAALLSRSARLCSAAPLANFASCPPTDRPAAAADATHGMPRRAGGARGDRSRARRRDRGVATSATETLMEAAAGSSSRRSDPPRLGPLIDVDCNLLHPDLASLLPGGGGERDVFRILDHPSTVDAGVVAALSPSSTVDESERSVELLLSALNDAPGGASDEEGGSAAAARPIDVRTTAGVHPFHASEAGPPTPGSLDRLRAVLLADRRRAAAAAGGDGGVGGLVSAVGETGLDYSDGFPPREAQIPWFESQLDLAFEFGLPLFVHERLAFGDTVRLIDEAAERHGGAGDGGTGPAVPPIVVHCFTGTLEEAAEYVRRGYLLSISGYVNRSGDGPDEVRRCLREGVVPLDRLMIETDSPYMGFPSCRDAFFGGQGDAFGALPGKKRKRLLRGIYPNVPSSLPLVLRGIVAALNEGREERGGAALDEREVAAITTRNAIGFFGFRRASDVSCLDQT